MYYNVSEVPGIHYSFISLSDLELSFKLELIYFKAFLCRL